MKAIMVMFDSLNRNFLPPYGCPEVYAPNFVRLAERTVTFHSAYAGSLPCMPARRELHTGRLNFLHRGWSPLEPFDDSMPELLSHAGVHTHLVSDHGHYWEDGGATYHTRYSTWECIRGQEGDPWKGNLSPDIQADTMLPGSNPEIEKFKQRLYKQDAVNRIYRADKENSCQKLTFDRGLEFIETNQGYDNWFLQIESFDPHEPFYSFEEYLKQYEKPALDRDLDWPPYDRVHQTEEEIAYIRAKYMAMISMCDENLGRVLDMMDRYDLWKDTMLIVNTDHGFLLGEHGWWAKNIMPCYQEIVNIPLFIWDPRYGKRGEYRNSLVQTIDMAPTLLEYFGCDQPKDMTGKALGDTILEDRPVREFALFGYHGNQLNITDGRYVYMRAAVHPEIRLYEYTLMPNRMNCRMGAELEQASLAQPFGFTKNMPVLKIPASEGTDAVTRTYGTQLFDLQEDPGQQQPIKDEAQEKRLRLAMKQLLEVNEAPGELLKRMGL